MASSSALAVVWTVTLLKVNNALDRFTGEQIEEHLRDRARVFGQLVAKWEETRLPKGLSLPQKPYVHARDRARHFANRSPDMTYLILDEQLLDLEGYLERLKDYSASYEHALNQGRRET